MNRYGSLTEQIETWPNTDETIAAEYDRREGAYLGLPYTRRERVDFGSFEARDVQDRVIASARRVLRDIAFVAEVDAASIATARVVCRVRSDVDSQSPTVLEAWRVLADGIWRRSRVEEQLGSWALRGCFLGRWLFEAQRDAAGLAYIIGHDPRKMRVWRDGFGAVTRALLRMEVAGSGPSIGPDGSDIAAAATVLIRRDLTVDRHRTFRDNQITQDDESALGVVPVVSWVYRDVGYELPGWAGQGYESCLASVDSAFSQLHAIGTRHANPVLKTTGALIEDGADLAGIGRTMNLPQGATADWLEPAMVGISALVEKANAQLAALRATVFEFLFTEAGAGSSGLALSHRAAGYVAKIEPIRQSFYRTLALVTSYAVAIEMNKPWTEAFDVFEVDGGEALPLDVEAMAALYMSLVSADLLKPHDAVAAMQGLGLVPDGNPLLYWEELQAAKRARQTEVEDAVIQEIRDNTPDDGVDDTEPDPADAPDEGGAAVDTGSKPLLIGQITGAQEIVRAVAEGQLPRTAGIAQLVELIQLPADAAERVMGDVGRGFKPAVEAPAADPPKA